MESSNKPKVVLISGVINAGKSTVGKLLSEKMKAAFVEGDSVRGFLFWKLLEEVLPQVIMGIASSVRTLVGQGYSVVVSYPLRQEDYDVLKESWKDLDISIHAFVLSPRKDAVLTNRGTRELTDWEKQRIHELHEMGIHAPAFAMAIDNTNQSPEETVEQIFTAVMAK